MDQELFEAIQKAVLEEDREKLLELLRPGTEELAAYYQRMLEEFKDVQPG